ncbi:MAG: hypothetical protein MJY89_07200 [Bacteroidales bacterium]|nr:hypothetical protein [Bacteroidales bacterium]
MSAPLLYTEMNFFSVRTKAFCIPGIRESAGIQEIRPTKISLTYKMPARKFLPAPMMGTYIIPTIKELVGTAGNRQIAKIK